MIDRGHPEATCEECGGPNMVWFAPSDLWNVAVDENRGMILCPICFVRRAEQHGIKPTAWVVRPEANGADRIYVAEEWEHGLRCGSCHGLFVEGQPIAERLEAFDDDVPVCVLTCVSCDLEGAPIRD